NIGFRSGTTYKWDSWTILGILELNPFVFVVNSKSPYKTLDDLLDAIKKNPGKLTYSHSGPSTVLALSSQMLLQLGGLKPSDAIGIPYKGGGPAKVALMGGHVDFMGFNLSAAIDQLKGGELRALAVTTKERFPAISDVPTVREAGYPELESLISWSGLYGPPNMPAEVVNKWAAALQGVKKDKTWNKITKSIGSIPYILTPQESKQFAKQQYEMYSKLGKSLGLIIK
ncbi:MAG: tripartite tricarboxylate transporter substrate binding protein, partial [Kiritimatiellae bacterium]|nr:tripartite tricarboxylate transporter substrate binding protein [Kiritimatiellia bacterium]